MVDIQSPTSEIRRGKKKKKKKNKPQHENIMVCPIPFHKVLPLLLQYFLLVLLTTLLPSISVQIHLLT